ncbi:MAG: type II toxin-antitoxin system CcdA family antitoxin [Rhodopila sp.]
MNRRASETHEGPKRATNLSLSESLVWEARELSVNLSQAAEDGIARAVAAARRAAWVERNRPAMESWNEYVRQNGLPLEDLSLF